jgi:hypothetical protein
MRSTQPPIQWVPGALSAGVKRPGREVDHSPPTSAEVMKMWIYTSAPLYAFMTWCLISRTQGKLYLFTMGFRNFTLTALRNNVAKLQLHSLHRSGEIRNDVLKA